MITIQVDGRSLDVEAGTSLLHALEDAGVEVPHQCDDRRLAPAGVCRLCTVELAGVTHPVTSCTTPVSAGMVVRTRSPALDQHRALHERMLAQRPPDDATLKDDSHPYLSVDMSRCVACLRCVRICADVQGQFVWHTEGRGAELRVVLDHGQRLLDSSCVSCGACADTCPTGAIVDKTRLRLGAATHVTRTTCPYCGTGCEMDVGARDGQLVSSTPALDSPVNKGHLCVKGRYAFEFVHDRERITEPMLRDARGWRRVTWDEALDFVAQELLRLRQEHGPDSVGVLGSARATNEDNYVTQKLARLALGTNNVDCCARVCHGPTAAAMSTMLGTGAATNSYADIERTRLMLVCGANPTESHPIVGARIKQAARHGAELIVIDPRRTELARLARFHLRLRAGSNVPLLHALAHVIVNEGLVNREFIAERVTDLAAFQQFIATFSPEATATLTGVEPELVRAAARAYAQAGPAMIFHGLGVTEHTQGTEGVECLVNLALLTGNFGKPGSGVNPLRGQNNVQGAAHMGCEPSHLTGYADLTTAAPKFAAVWGAELPPHAGLNMLRMVDAAGDGRLRGLIAVGYDVGLTNPDMNHTLAALERLELLVVQDLFMTATARASANVFLPACSSFEKDGTFMTSERRVQRVRRALDPIGNSRPDWQIVCSLAARLGHAREFAFESAEQIWEEVRRVWPAGAGISYRRLERGGLQWPCPTDDHPGTPILHLNGFAKQPRAALALVPYVPTTERTDQQFPMTLITGRSLYQFNAGTMTMHTPNRQLRPQDLLEVCAEDAAALGLPHGSPVRIVSRWGEATLPLQVTDRVSRGEVFATFHTLKAQLNRVTSPHRDRVVDSPEYKVTAVRLEAARPLP